MSVKAGYYRIVSHSDLVYSDLRDVYVSSYVGALFLFGEAYKQTEKGDVVLLIDENENIIEYKANDFGMNNEYFKPKSRRIVKMDQKDPNQPTNDDLIKDHLSKIADLLGIEYDKYHVDLDFSLIDDDDWPDALEGATNG